jgi:endonuclease/exonuclease/phosphatase family metal-dependent hydrolase
MNRWRKQYFVKFILLCFTTLPFLHPSPGTALRICTYNVLNYPGTTGPQRDPNFRHVIAQFDPDVLVMEEFHDSADMNQFLSNVLNYGQPGKYAAAPFVNGYDTDNAMFYKSDKVDLISHYVIDTDLRDIDEWKFRPDGYTAEEASIRLYVVHLKASQGSDNEQKRLEEVQAMRARMETFPVGQNYIVAGDFNIYQSTEPAYINMTSPDSGLAGVVHDPINRVGNWHDSWAFRDVWSQSTQLVSFAGGATGGMDDRFDQILISGACDDDEGISYISNSYVTFGNDALLEDDRWNNAINDPPNQAVPETTANALYYASDHLPVYLDIQVPAKIETDVSSLDFDTVIVDATAQETLWVFNVAAPAADELDYEFSAPTGFTAPSGFFSVDAGDSSDHIISMNTSLSGNKSGDLEIASDDVDDPTSDVTLSGTVLDHAQPSTDSSTVATEDTVDFGAHEIGQFSDQIAQIHNYDYDALQALLNVYDAQIVGAAGRFSIIGGFSPSDVGTAPGSYNLHFDDAGAAEDSTYRATLTFSTRDQQGLLGGTDLSDLAFQLFATVQSGLSPIDDLTIYKNGETMKLIWTPKSGADLYRIYSDDQDPYFTPLAPTDSTTETTWVDPAPSAMARYYVVRGVKGTSESDDSNRVGTFDKDLINAK